MTYDSDPPRLRVSGDPGDPFVQALEEAHRELPTAEQLEAVAARFAVEDAAPSLLASSRARLRARGVQLGAAALAIAAAVGATVLITHRLPLVTAEGSGEPAAAPAPVVVPEKAAAHQEPAVTESPVAPEQAHTAEPVKPHTPSNARRTPPPAPAAAPSQGELPTSDVDGPSAEAEAALLGRAHQALASNPARALSLTDEHRREYPAGALTQESDLIAIEALASLGRSGDARAAAARFRARYPSSAHLRRIDRLLGDAPASSGK